MISNEDIISQINKAIVTHSRWKLRLQNALETYSSEFEIDFVKSPHNCDFGKWLDAEKDHLNKFPEYAQVYDIHARVHQETEKVIQLLLDGHVADAKNAIATGSHFKIISSELTKIMTQWKNSL